MKLALVGYTKRGFKRGETLTPELLGSPVIPVKCNYESTYEHWNGIYDYYNVMVVCALVNVTKDFDPNSDDLIEIDSDTDSYQIRPKLIYKDKKGYFYKPHGKVVRFKKEDVEQLIKFLKYYEKK